MKFNMLVPIVLGTVVAIAAPQEPVSHYKRGRALREKGDSDGALAEFRQALRLDPSSADAHCELGFVLYDKSRSVTDEDCSA